MSKGMTIGPHKEKDAAAVDATADLFAGPPKSSIDLRERLAPLHHPTVREAVVDKLEGADLSDRDGPLILAILDVIGIGDERPRLISIALNSRGEARVRMWAAMALAGDDPRMMDLLVTELGPEGMAHLAENALLDLITIQQPSRIGTTVVRALEEWHRDLSADRLLNRLEACRIGIGVSCVEAYGPSLLTRRLESLRPQILDFFVAEASDEGAEFILALRERNDIGDRNKLQSALLRLRSAVIDPEHRTDRFDGLGYVSNCDGNGGFIVLGVFDNPDATKSVSELYLHVQGDILDGVIHPRLRPEQTAEVIDQLKDDAGCHFVSVSMEETAALVAIGLDKTGTADDAERGEVRQALRLFARALPMPFVSEPPSPDFHSSLSKAAVEALLARVEYEDTWVFDASDLQAEGITLNESETPSAAWIQEATKRIAASGRREQIVAMAEHMAKWHRWNQEQDVSIFLTALAEDVRRSPDGGYLIHVMLERSNS